MTKNNDSLKCERLEINTMKSPTDATKQIPKDYKATGDVEFTFYTQDSIFKGKGETVLYYPLDKKYIIIGDGYLEDVNGGKKIIANKIYVDEKTGHTRIEGEKDKPIKFRLKLDDTKK
jgi:lipopolysaccharide export system protein LptA